MSLSRGGCEAQTCCQNKRSADQPSTTDDLCRQQKKSQTPPEAMIAFGLSNTAQEPLVPGELLN